MLRAMFTLVRNLKLNCKDTLDDVVESCDKIILWLSTLPTHQCTLHYEDVELFLKAALYVEECMAMFGELPLKQILVEHCPLFTEFYKAQTDLLKKDMFISHLITRILSTGDGLQFLPVIEEILRNYYDNEHIVNLVQIAGAELQNSSKDLSTQMQCHRSRMLLALEKLFQTPHEQFYKVLDRMISQLHFQVLGHVLLEPTESVYFAKCSIVVQHICQSLTAVRVPAYFIDSLHQTVAFSREGRFSYWKFLANKLFAYHLRNFFIKYFESLIHETEVPETLQHYNFQKISYLLIIALCQQSPCRLAYQRALNKANILPFHFALIQRFIRIYH